MRVRLRAEQQSKVREVEGEMSGNNFFKDGAAPKSGVSGTHSWRVGQVDCLGAMSSARLPLVCGQDNIFLSIVGG